MLIPVTPASAEPVSVAEAKAHLRVIHDADDALIGRQITAAREEVEQVTGRALAAASYRWLSRAPAEAMTLPLWPVSAVSAVSYLDADGARIVVDDYTLDADRSLLTYAWPSMATAVNVEFDVEPAAVPEALKSAILLLVQAEYESTPDDAKLVRDRAYAIAWTYRMNLGV